MTEETYYTEKVLAKKWSISQKTLQRRRKQGIGPPFIKMGASVRYVPESIRKFEEEHTHITSSKSNSSYNKILFNKNKQNYEPK